MYWQLIKKRCVYVLPILMMVHLLTFFLFFVVNSPDDVARAHLGPKYLSQEAIARWKSAHGLNKPLFYNTKVQGLSRWRETIFFDQTHQLFLGDFGQALNGENIRHEISVRILPSLAIAIPSLLLGLVFNIMVAMVLVIFRNTHLNQVGLILTIISLSISTLFYIIFSQYFLAFVWRWFPISGYMPGVNAVYFVALPVIVHILAGLGRGGRWYRSLFLEEIEQPYVHTAFANGLAESKIMVHYVLRNCLLVLSTAIVAEIPLLFLGSVLYESFFSIPGLGNYLLQALQHQDFIVVRTMVLLGSFAYMLGLILTDVIYIFIDPRVRLT